MRVFLAIAALAFLPACGGGATGSSSGGGPILLPPPPSTAENNTFAGLLNTVRVNNGAGTVAYDSRLGVAAQSHANDMVANDFLDHTGSNGSTIRTRAEAAGYTGWTRLGENIAQGQQSQQAVLTAWTNSPGHHANNINPLFDDFGLAKAGSGSDLRWVLMLGSQD
ncbi:MAG: CAP domain-containing protein [Rhodobacterales bacterium]|nr:MAG: CAP domain-containing protein [Rhodobacterales bacterium]